MRYTFILFLSFFSIIVHAQENLIPNPGFESIEKETRGHAFLDNVQDWENTNQNPPPSLYGTPDHMFINNKQPLQGIKDSFAPRQGHSVLGLITYLQRVVNYREFASVKLKSKLKKGERYYCKFHICNGKRSVYGSIATNGLGFSFTKDRLKQYRYEPIETKTQFYINRPLYTREWKTYEFTFTAEEDYEYLTIGNFLKDDELDKVYINYDIDPQAYVYIDDIELRHIEGDQIDPSLVAKEEVQTEKESFQEDIAPEMEEPKEDKLQQRNVDEQYVIDIPSYKITLKVWDDFTVDGDEISLLFNDYWVVQNYILKKKKRKLEIRFDPNKDNQLILFAHNLGKEPPNTATIQIKSGNKKKILNIKSDLGKCGAITFKVK